MVDQDEAARSAREGGERGKEAGALRMEEGWYNKARPSVKVRIEIRMSVRARVGESTTDRDRITINIGDRVLFSGRAIAKGEGVLGGIMHACMEGHN